jgi:hypothetical protein
MKKVLLITLLVLIAAVGAAVYGGYRAVRNIIAAGGCVGCVQVNNGGPTISGSGHVKTETRNIGDFSSIRLISSAEVFITGAAADSVTVTADDNLLPLFTSEVKDGTLSLSYAKDKSFQSKNRPIYHVSVANLRELDVAGAGDVKASKLDSNALSVVVTGSSDVHLAGRAGDLMLLVSGSSSVDAGGLQAKSAKVTVSGASEATVNASDALDAQVSGAASVSYFGAPKLTKKISGAGSIKQKQ